MPNDISTILRALRETSQSVELKSQALKPIGAMLVPICTLAGFVFLKDTDPWIRIFMAVLVGAFALSGIVGFWYLMFKDRDRLGSETFVTSQQHLKILASHGLDALPAIDVEDPSPPSKKALLPAPATPQPPQSMPPDEEAP